MNPNELHIRLCKIEDTINQLSSRLLNMTKAASLTTDANTSGKQHTSQVRSYGVQGEVHNDVTVAGQYGFAAAHLSGARAITHSPYGNNQSKFISAVFDPRYHPIGLKAGETQQHDNQGQFVYLSLDGLQVNGKEKIFLQIEGHTIMEISSEGIDITGKVTASGDGTFGGISVDQHIHTSGKEGSPTSKPN